MNIPIPIKRFLLFVVFVLSSCYAPAQEYRYVNTNNLILRDRPEKIYNVFAILHAPCRVKVEPYQSYYKNNKAVTGKFYEVSITYNDNNGMHHYTNGWVEKKYVVDGLDKITVPGADKSLELSESEIVFTPYIGDDEHDPDKRNASEFPAPKYKGGEKQPAPFKKVYRSGARDGCYYVNVKGRKVYVDKKFCK